MAAILGLEWTFYPEVAPESEDIHVTKIATAKPYDLHSWLAT